jgi:hypothetical protein
MEFQVPPLSVQIKIADLLDTFEDCASEIENLRTGIDTSIDLLGPLLTRGLVAPKE